MADGASSLPDIKSADTKAAILDPLLLLLATRRGFKQDSHFTTTKIPEDYLITYRGRSGVDVVDHTALWVRFFWGIACWSNLQKFFVLMAPAGLLLSTFDHYYPLGEGEFDWQMPTVGAVCVLQLLFYKLCRIIANRHIATMTPSWCDPESYQCRLTTAMGEAGIQYANIEAATLADMEMMWKSEAPLCENFRIWGLVDPSDRDQVYDIVVKFYNSGGITMQFRSPEDSPNTRPGILISNGTKEKM